MKREELQRLRDKVRAERERAPPKRIRCSHTTGAISELLACAWLINRGYRVFRNVEASGPADIVAIKGSKVFQFDVKTVVEGAFPPLTGKQYDLGILPLYSTPTGFVIGFAR